jgi:hypothetical protein
MANAPDFTVPINKKVLSQATGNAVPGNSAILNPLNSAPSFTTGGFDPTNDIPASATSRIATSPYGTFESAQVTPSILQSKAVDQATADANRAQNEADVAAKFAADGLKSPATTRATNTNPSDWRVRLSLAELADYLYLDSEDSGILAPLLATNGVVFPYTPKIDQTYDATYEQADLVHSNYKGYFYKNSAPGPITITGTFTANSTDEANYVLAVIHFFRSATKMFYGQDTNRGIPPPVCFLNGLGTYQFNNHPVVIQQFQYSLPNEVDYIKAGTVGAGLGASIEARKRPERLNPSSLSRLLSSGLFKGASAPKANTSLNVDNYSVEDPTYVPTKLDITITLLPLQSRAQMSSEFSLKKYGSGELTKKGFY